MNEPGFEDLKTVLTVFAMCAFGDYLYAAWAACPASKSGARKRKASRRIIGESLGPRGWRGPLNQGAVAMQGFQDALYISTGIQNGGNDMRNKIGPAAAEVLRLSPDGSYDIICGTARNGQKPLSGLGAGFGNFFRLPVDDGSPRNWLYASTMDWSIILKFSKVHEKPSRVARLIAQSGWMTLLYNGGFELWRTADGVNWVPVSRTGMGNPYNFGGRNLVSTPHGLFVGTLGSFGPKVAVRQSPTAWDWVYEPTPRGAWKSGRASAEDLPGMPRGRPGASTVLHFEARSAEPRINRPPASERPAASIIRVLSTIKRSPLRIGTGKMSSSLTRRISITTSYGRP